MFDRKLHALGDITQHVAEDLAALDADMLRVLHLFHIADFSALPVVIMVHGLDQQFPERFQVLLGIIRIA